MTARLAAADLAAFRLLRTAGHTPRAERGRGGLLAAGRARGRLARDRRGGHGVSTARGGRAGGVPRRRSPAPICSTPRVKLVVRRARPDVDGLPPLTGTPTGLSFPSAHATTLVRGRRACSRPLVPGGAGPLLALASAMAVSRLYLGVHCPSDVLAGRRARHAWPGAAAAMKVGIVGMPNAGKSSLFNALTRAGAEAANYPFTTIEPNVAVVPVRRRAPRPRSRRPSGPRRSSTTRSTSTTSPASSPARTRARGSATSSSPTSARPTRSCTSCAPHRRQRHPPRRPRRPARRHRDDRDRADLRRPRAGRAPPRARRPRRPRRRARGRSPRRRGCEELVDGAARAAARRATSPPPEDAPDALRVARAADRQAGAVRRQRRRGRRRGPGGDRRARRGPGRRRGRGLRAPRGRAGRARRRRGRRDARGARRRRVRPAAGRRAARSRCST